MLRLVSIIVLEQALRVHPARLSCEGLGIRTMYDTQVIIVGAGPTGLTLGIELARRAIAFRLLDAAEARFRGSRGEGIQPCTLEVFEDLGIIEAILKAGMPYPGFRVHVGQFSLRLGLMGGRASRPSEVTGRAALRHLLDSEGFND